MDSKEENIVSTRRSVPLKTSEAPATPTKDLEFGGVPGRQRPCLAQAGQWRGRKGLSWGGWEAAGHEPGGGLGSVLVSGGDLKVVTACGLVKGRLGQLVQSRTRLNCFVSRKQAPGLAGL